MQGRMLRNLSCFAHLQSCAPRYQLIASGVTGSQQSHVTRAPMLVNIGARRPRAGQTKNAPRARKLLVSRCSLNRLTRCSGPLLQRATYFRRTLVVLFKIHRDAFLRQRLAISGRVVDQNGRRLGEAEGAGNKSNAC